MSASESTDSSYRPEEEEEVEIVNEEEDDKSVEIIDEEGGVNDELMKELSKKLRSKGAVEFIELPGDFVIEEEEFYDLEEEFKRLEEENPVLFAELTKVKEYLSKELPDIERILETEMSLENKAKLVELFEMFVMSEPLSFEWIALKKQLNVLFVRASNDYKTQQKLSDEDKSKLEEQLAKIKSMSSETSIETQIALLNIPVKYKTKLYERYQKMQNIDSSSDEYSKSLEWMQTILRFPWGVYKPQPPLDVIKNIKEELDREFYGMDTIKEQLLLFINNRLNNPERNDYCLGLIGPAGTGKTGVALSISRVLNFPFQQLSGGSLVNTDDIHGHSFTYIGSGPGDIVNALMRMECLNGIIFIDEFDKIPLEKSLNSLLQLLDPVQNHNFKDKYIGDIPIDLSRTWFICSMNDYPDNQALKDRIFTIEVPGYTDNQKMNILQKHTLPKLLKDFKVDVKLDKDALRSIVQRTQGNKGMRQPIHLLKDALSKVQFLKQHPNISTSFQCDLKVEAEPITITKTHLDVLLPSKQSSYSSMYS